MKKIRFHEIIPLGVFHDIYRIECRIKENNSLAFRFYAAADGTRNILQVFLDTVTDQGFFVDEVFRAEIESVDAEGRKTTEEGYIVYVSRSGTIDPSMPF